MVMKYGMEQLPIPELDDFDDKRKVAHFMLNDAEHALQIYGDSVDLTGENIVERYDRKRRIVEELTRIGINAGYLNQEMIET